MADDQDRVEEAADSGTPAFISPPREPDLPDFEGREVVGVVTKVNGTSGRIDHPIHVGQRLYALVELEAEGVNHKRTKEGLKRHHTLAVLDLYELDAETGRQYVAAERQRLADAGLLDGQQSFDDVPGVDVTVDGSGVALTPGEIAEQRGGVDGVDQLADGAAALPPWLGYDHQSLDELRERIAVLDSVDELQAVIHYELGRDKPRLSLVNAATRRRDTLEETAR